MEQFNPDSEQRPFGSPEFPEIPGWGGRLARWFKRHATSTVLPLVAILILASGIYLYSKQKGQEAAFLEQGEETKFDLGEENGLTEEDITAIQKPEELDLEKGNQSSPGTGIEGGPEETSVKGEIKGETIIEKTQKGEGVTHLARRALKDYEEEFGKDTVLTKEHKIYIEDYLKDKVGSRWLNVDEEISFEKKLIEEAIAASKKLSESELNNLNKYAALVPSII